jgi:hypothetical protein
MSGKYPSGKYVLKATFGIRFRIIYGAEEI